MDDWEELEHDAFGPQDRTVNVSLALAGAVATTAPLVVGLAVGHHELGLFGAIGGLNTAVVMTPTTRVRRTTWGCLTACSGTAAVGLATLTHRPAWIAVVVTVLWSVLWALFRALGPEGALVGFTTTAVFIIVNGLPGSASMSEARMVEYAAGSALALLLLSIPAPTRGAAVAHLPWSAIARRAREKGIIRRHAVRIGLVAGVATVVYRALNLTFGYWVPLTAVAVLQPDAKRSRVRALQRSAGTLGGTAIVAMVALTTSNEWVLVGVIFVVAGGLFALKERSYFWLTMLLTPTALLMTSTVRFYGWDIAITRVTNTAIGLVLAVVAIELVSRWRVAGAR